MIADRDYLIDRNGKLAKSGADAAYLLVAKGQEIPEAIAKRYGIGSQKPKPAENKSVAPSVEFKIAARAEDAAELPAPVTPKKRAPRRKK